MVDLSKESTKLYGVKYKIKEHGHLWEMQMLDSMYIYC